jgi:hypothetical protein
MPPEKIEHGESEECEQGEGIKWLALVGAGLYAIGLLLTNEYLSFVGISDFSSLRPKYLITGGWCVLLFFFASLPAILSAAGFISTFKRRAEKETRRDSLRIAAALVVALVIFWASFKPMVWALHLFLRIVEDDTDPRADLWAYATLPEATKVVLILSILIAIGVVIADLKTKGRFKFGVSSYVTLSVIAIGALTIATFGVAEGIYDKVLPAYGGGKPMAAELILTREGADFWKQAGAVNQPTGDSTSTGLVDIVYENEQNLILKVPYQKGPDRLDKIVVIDKKLVSGILPLKGYVPAGPD